MVNNYKRQELIDKELNDVFNKRIWQAPFDEVLVPVGVMKRLYVGPSITRPYLAYWQFIEDGHILVDIICPGDPGYYIFKDKISAKEQEYSAYQAEKILREQDEKANRPKTFKEKIKLFFGYSI